MTKKTRTWRVSEDVAEKISEVAEREAVWDSHLVELFLRCGLDALEAGDLEIPKRDPERLLIDWSQANG
jgi:hypothetical protein